MKVTGYQLREAIKQHELQLNGIAKLFTDSLWRFADDDKPTPMGLVERYQTAEVAVARLQTAQARYNLSVNIDVQGDKMTLCEGIKRIGNAGRVEKMWRTAVSGDGHRSSYALSAERSRNKDTEHAVRSMSIEQLMAAAKKAAGYAGNLRAAIAQANNTAMEIEGLDTSLFS